MESLQYASDRSSRGGGGVVKNAFAALACPAGLYYMTVKELKKAETKKYRL